METAACHRARDALVLVIIMTPDNTPVLVVRNLHKSFGSVQALRGIDLTLDRPGVYGFLGPNGSGKTTTFKTTSGLLQPSDGTAHICGIDVHQDTKAAVSHLGVQFDAPTFYPYLSGRDNLHVAVKWLGGITHTTVDDLLGLVGLSDAAARKVGGYSSGMKQRLGLAAALLSDPKLLLLDEPTNGLDPRGIADMRSLLPQLAREEERVVLLSSHRMEEVEQICDFIYVIYEGSLVASGKPAELTAGGDQIEIECADAAAATAALQALPGVAGIETVNQSRLLVTAPDIRPSTINKLLLEQGIAVNQVVRKKESLEEVFFRLTEGEGHGR